MGSKVPGNSNLCEVESGQRKSPQAFVSQKGEQQGLQFLQDSAGQKGACKVLSIYLNPRCVTKLGSKILSIFILQ